MKKPLHRDPAFYAALFALLAAALVLWIWETTRLPPGPSRVGWPSSSSVSHP